MDAGRCTNKWQAGRLHYEMMSDECNSSSITQTSSPELLAGRCGAAPAQLPVATQEGAVATLFELLLEAPLPSPVQVPGAVRIGQHQQAVVVILEVISSQQSAIIR